METQNLTLSLPKETLRRVKVIAAQRETSVSRLVTRALEALVEDEDRYLRARQRHLRWLEQAADLGTGGAIGTRREELHERR
jgi:predicted transcriptional regulator